MKLLEEVIGAGHFYGCQGEKLVEETNHACLLHATQNLPLDITEDVVVGNWEAYDQWDTTSKQIKPVTGIEKSHSIDCQRTIVDGSL